MQCGDITQEGSFGVRFDQVCCVPRIASMSVVQRRTGPLNPEIHPSNISSLVQTHKHTTADRANGHELVQLLLLPSGHQYWPNEWALLLIGAGEGLQKVTADILLYKLREREKTQEKHWPMLQRCRKGMIVIERARKRIVSAI
jgi:hypothetical protein